MILINFLSTNTTFLFIFKTLLTTLGEFESWIIVLNLVNNLNYFISLLLNRKEKNIL